MSSPIGGQAVLEGVMMRGPSAWSVAVRKPDGAIAEVNHPISSPMARHRIFRLPIIRGVIALGESLAIGFRALAISANYASQEEGEEGEPPSELSRGAIIFAFLIAIGFAVALFKVTPALVTNWLPFSTGDWFVVVEGLIRVTMFVLYLAFLPSDTAARLILAVRERGIQKRAGVVRGGAAQPGTGAGGGRGQSGVRHGTGSHQGRRATARSRGRRRRRPPR